MRSLSNTVGSLNWRLVWIGTFLFMGLYFVAFDKRSLTPEQIQEISKELPIAKGASKTGGPPKKNIYDARFDDQVRIEEPNPLLGKKYDSPLDGIPGRQRPIIPDMAKESEAAKKKQDEEEKKKEAEEKEKKKEVEEKEKQERLAKEKAAEKAKTETAKMDVVKKKPKKPDGDKPQKDGPKNTAKDTEKNTSPSADASKTKNPSDESKEKEPTENSPSDVKKPVPAKEADKGKDSADAKNKPDEASSLSADIKELEDTATPTGTPAPPPDEDIETMLDAADLKAMNITRTIPPEDYVALCIAVKDQADDLPEFFIHHYHHIGIRRFYIMDDRSDPPLDTVKDYGIPNEFITFDRQDQYERIGGHQEQMAVMGRCLHKWGHHHTWMGFIDVDELIEMTAGNETLQEMLHELEERDDIGALAMNWQMHTSSGHKTRPKSARKAFVDCIWDDDENGGIASNNTHVKSIVRTSKAVNPVGPHTWYLANAITVGEHLDLVASEAWRLPITRDRIALHHYAGKSREEYEAKMLRGNAMDDPKGESFWNSLEHGLPLVPCPEMAKYDP